MATEPRCYQCGYLLDDIDAACPHCVPCFYGHDWETSGQWGVVVGMSRCRRCGKLSTEQHFAVAQVATAKPEGEDGG